ncbi:hypothetical protein [Arthrobacter sp. D5-1]|uniref:hypothetical protein n=1 Tax=Arthrobacter sp. D5-1 TaxID=1477518 RepID=UPI001A9979C4|nr:hypothetical protein [Arthrobacter sp. D5-1]
MIDLIPFVDKYQTHRGGYSVFLRCTCAACGHPLFVYQKDGPGPLLRCYWNRIRINIGAGMDDGLSCSACERQLGELFQYKDGRPAFALNEDALKTEEMGESVVLDILDAKSKPAFH